jgi:hypothetical protein
MSDASAAIFTEVEGDVRACEDALRRAQQQLKDKPKWWRRKRIRRIVKAGHVIEQQLKELVERYRLMVCPVTLESVVTPDLEEALRNACACTIQTSSGLKSPIQLLTGEGWCQAAQWHRFWPNTSYAAALGWRRDTVALDCLRPSDSRQHCSFC